MARKTFASFDIASSPTKIWQAIATALATMASGKNPDATDYTLPVTTDGLGINAAATPAAVASGTADAQAVAATANLRLLGFSARESAGTPAAAIFNIRNGVADTAPIVAVVNLAASGSVQHTFPRGGVACAGGVFIERVSGETELVVYSKAVA